MMSKTKQRLNQMNKTTKTTIKLRDEVKHKTADMIGTVLAIYPDKVKSKGEYQTLLDVRGANDKIYYGTPAKNWETVRTEEEMW